MERKISMWSVWFCLASISLREKMEILRLGKKCSSSPMCCMVFIQINDQIELNQRVSGYKCDGICWLICWLFHTSMSTHRIKAFRCYFAHQPQKTKHLNCIILSYEENTNNKKIPPKLIMITCTSSEIRWTGWFQRNSLTALPPTSFSRLLLIPLSIEANVQFCYIFSLMRSVSNFRICSSLHIFFFLLESFQFQLCAGIWCWYLSSSSVVVEINFCISLRFLPVRKMFSG